MLMRSEDAMITAEVASRPSTSPTITERDAIVARVALEAHDLFRHTGVPQELIDEFVEEAVDELWDGSIKVTSFVPVLALRTVREKVTDVTGAAPASERRSP
jgi:hypothetical protein